MSITRREFLASSARAATMLSATPALTTSQGKTTSEGETGLPRSDLTIEREVLWNGREGTSIWFHPRPCVLPGKQSMLMTMQSISGSDVYGQVHWTHSDDLGHTWMKPRPIGAFARRDVADGMQEGICDVVPQYHAPTSTVLAIGHNVYYRGERLTQPYRNRFPVYAIGDGSGFWSKRERLEWDHADTSGIYTCGCGERWTLENGEILIPVSYGPAKRADRAVTTLRCAYNGKQIKVLQSGSELRLKVKRGLLEPSLVHHADRYLLTIRAEDGHGYSAVSEDGTKWRSLCPWRWDDGEELVMSTTQQHWLRLGDRLYLVYTRRDATNGKVMRYRAPLYMARVDPGTQSLVRASERVVLPLRGDPERAPKDVARMGNFHTLRVTDTESWVTVGEARPTARYKGDVLLARIHLAR